MDNVEYLGKQVSADDLVELVKLFEGFSQASSTFAQSYRALESRISRLSAQLEEQVRLLRRTEGFLSSVLANVTAGILVLDLEGDITLFNDYAERLTGVTSEDIIGKPYGEVFACRVMEPDSALFTLTTGTMIDSREKDLVVLNKNTIPVRFSTSWIYDEHGERAGVLEVFEDLRVLREMEARMRQNANLAALGEMAAQMAHELRNPLAGVQGFAQFLQEDIREGDPARSTVDKIIQGVREIDQIAGRLLEFTNPINPNFERVDLVSLLKDVGDLVEAEIHGLKKKIRLELELPEESVAVSCDAQLIKQAVLNLLKNAINACEGDSGEKTPQLALQFPMPVENREGVIRVGLNWDLLRNRVRLWVQDNGMGISDTNLDKIFSPFFTTRNRGSGLGLSMVKKILNVHRGEIRVESTPGKGSRFELEMPIARLS